MFRDKKVLDTDSFHRSFDIANQLANDIFVFNRPNSLYSSVEILIMKYVRGDPYDDLRQHFLYMIETALILKEACIDSGTNYPDYEYYTGELYIFIAFAYALKIDDMHWNILTNDIFTAENDWILDKLIECKDPNRKIADYQLAHRFSNSGYLTVLYSAINAKGNERILLIKKHLKLWHSKRNNSSFRRRIGYGSDPDKDYYIGQFAFEVAAVVMAFDIDDTEFKEDIYYPKELVDHWRKNK